MTERTFPPFLYIETSPGCETEADAKLKIKAALVALLFWCLPNVPCATRWLTCTGTLGWYLLGCLVNKLFVRGYRACFEKSEGALNLKNLGNWNDATRATGDVDMEASNDEWHVRLGKRLRRGARFFSDRLCAATMTFSLLIMLPLHVFMSGVFGESKKQDVDVGDISEKNNRCADRITKLLHADIYESDEWLLMRCADREVLADQSFRRCPAWQISTFNIGLEAS